VDGFDNLGSWHSTTELLPLWIGVTAEIVAPYGMLKNLQAAAAVKALALCGL
jgi:hypothetical protein